MSLYNKNLNSLAELRKEKARLEIQKTLSPISKLNPLAGGTKGKSPLTKALKGFGKSSKSDGIAGAVLKALGAKSNIERAVILAPSILPLIFGNTKRKNSVSILPAISTPKPKTPNKALVIAKKVGLEVAGGYLKWKAIEMGFRGIVLIIKWQKDRKHRKLVKASAMLRS